MEKVEIGAGPLPLDIIIVQVFVVDVPLFGLIAYLVYVNAHPAGKCVNFNFYSYSSGC